MLSAAGSPLVAGSAASVMQRQFIRVLRPFFLDGKPVEAGAVVELPRHLAAEYIACGKAVATDPPQTPPPVEAPAVEAEPVRKTRGKKDARD